MDLHPSGTEMVVRLAAALVLGGVVGFEREWRQKPAGLRTHMLVALGAATLVLITAGSLWLVGAVGLGAGFGEVGVAAVAVVLALLILLGMDALKPKIPPH